MRLIATRRFFAVAIAMLACAATPAFAQFTRVTGFEIGDPAVSSIGDASNRTSYQGQAAPEGTHQFLLTTISATANEDAIGSQSGLFAAGIALLDNFFNSLSINGQEGSGVLIPFTIGSANDTLLTFQYDFLSNEPFQSMPRNDFAFAAIFNDANALQGNAATVADVSGSNFSLFNPNQSPFIFHTGYQTFGLSLIGLAPGNYTLGIGVADASTADHASGILLDNVQLVPEPSITALAVAGASLMLGLRRRIKRS